MKPFIQEYRKESEFEDKVLEVNRITRVVKGGRRLRFRAAVIVGNKKGRVGFGVAKGFEVAIAVEKAKKQAMKKLINVPIINKTIPHQTLSKFGSTKVLLKPASFGTSLIAGSSVRSILQLAGYENIISKTFGSTNKINSAQATLIGLTCLKMPVKTIKPAVSRLEKDDQTNKPKTEETSLRE